MNVVWIALLMVRRTFVAKRSWIVGLLLSGLIVIVISFVNARGGDVTEVKLQNLDVGPLGAQLVSDLQAAAPTVTFRPVGPDESPWLTIPADFSEALVKGGERPVVINGESHTPFFVGIESNIAVQVESWRKEAGGLLEAGVQPERMIEQLAAMPVLPQMLNVAAQPAYTVNPWLRFVSGIIIVWILMFVCGLVTFAIDDRAQHTMLRMFAAPVRSAEVALGYVLGSFLVGSLQIVWLLLLIKLGGFGHTGPAWIVFLTLECYLLAAIGLACAVGSMARSSKSISSVSAFAVIPTSMLGGTFWPVEMMPDGMQRLASFTPQFWALDGWMRAVSGESLLDIRGALLILLLMAAVLLSLGASILRPEEGGKGA